MDRAGVIETLNGQARAEGWTFVCSPAAQFDADKLNAVNELWRAQTHSGSLPARGDFSARALKEVLPDLTIAEIVETEQGTRYRYRLMGTRAAHYLGEMTGSFMDAHLPLAVYQRTAACYRAIVDARGPLRFVTRFSLDPINFLSAEFFAAPLSRDRLTPHMVMTVTEFRLSK